MKDYIMPLALAIIGSGSLFGFIQFLISRKDNKLAKDILSMKRSQCRTEMLVMMNHYSEETMEIMRIAKVYFCDLEGDFYMTSLFAKWLKEHNIEKPMWFDETK